MIFKVQTKEEGVGPVKNQGIAFQAWGTSSKMFLSLEKLWPLIIVQVMEYGLWH